MKFFLDNNLPPRLARALHALLEPEHECVPLIDRFSRDTADVDWITGLAREGDWVIVCGDFNILRNKAEKSAWRESRLTAFFLRRGWTRSKGLDLFSLTGRLIMRWPDLIEQARVCERGTAFEVPLTGKIRRLS